MPRPLSYPHCAVLRFALVVALAFTAPHADAQQYAITNIGGLGGFMSSHALGINNNGQVVGYGTLSTYATQVFVYSKGHMTLLNLPFSPSVQPYAINSLGTVTGEITGHTASRTLSNNTINVAADSLGTLGGESCGYAINDLGQVAGTSAIDVNGIVWHAFVWSPGGTNGPVSNPQMQDIGTLGGNYTQANGINNAGQVVGMSGTNTVANLHAFLWAAGATGGPSSNPQMMDLGVTPGYDESTATAINGSGQITVNSRMATYTTGIQYQGSAFIYTPSGSAFGITELGHLYPYDTIQALALNNQGQAVGMALNYYYFSGVAVLFMNGKVYDLNHALPYFAGSNIDKATGINDLGQIVADGVVDSQGYDQAVLLTPASLAAPVSLSCSPSAVADGQATTATITLSGPAPTGGAVVSLTQDGQDAGTTTVPAGQLTTTFSLTFAHVSAPKQVAIDATRSGITVEALVTVNPPPPALSSLSPSLVLAGGPDVTLTATGNNFTPTCVVQWRGGGAYGNLATTYVSPTQLTATIPASYTAASGYAYVSVLNTATNAASYFQVFLVNNPVPTLTAINPSTANAGSSAVTLMLTGTGFVPSMGATGSTARWNSLTLTTTYVSPTQLTATIPASYLVSTGTAQVTVYSPGGGTSNALPFTITTPPDTIAPVTTATLSGAMGSNGWYTSAVQVTLSATDNIGGSGVASTFYMLDAGPQQTYSAPFAVAGDGTHTFTYWSTDKAGNTESNHTASIKIDATAPVLTFGTASPAPNAAGWNNTSVSLPYTASDAASGVATVSPGTPLTFAVEGANQTQTITATDNAGNATSLASPAFSIDLTAPVTAASLSGTQGNGGVYTGTATVTLSANDALSGVVGTYYSVDGVSTQPYSTPFLVTGGGSHTVTYFSTDKAGNSEIAHTLTLNEDTSAPATTATLSGTSGTNGWYTSPVQMTLAASDPDGTSDVASTYYTLDNGSQQTYSAPFTITGDGAHTLTFYSTDKAGNAETAQSQTIRIDATAPAVAFGVAFPAPNSAGWNNSPVSVPYTDTDATSGVASASPVSPLTFAAEGAGQTQSVTATDNAGNSMTFTTPAVSIDLTAPITTSAVSGDTVTFSATDALSGLAGTFYKIDSGARRTYTTPFTITGTGKHAVSYYSIDIAGNTEAAHTLTVTIAKPTLSSLNPTAKVAGSSAFTLTVNGANFVAGGVVNWNGASRPTTFVSATRMTAAISASDIALAGMAAVSVTTYASTTASKTLTINPKLVLTSLSATSCKAGSAAFTLTASGTGFATNSVIKWNGVAEPTTFVSSTTLTASIAASLVATAGTAQITVTTPSVATSGKKAFTITH